MKVWHAGVISEDLVTEFGENRPSGMIDYPYLEFFVWASDDALFYKERPEHSALLEVLHGGDVTNPRLTPAIWPGSFFSAGKRVFIA
jgi:hypothetical protein